MSPPPGGTRDDSVEIRLRRDRILDIIGEYIRLLDDRMTLHCTYLPSRIVENRLALWADEAAIDLATPVTSWQLTALRTQARSASVGASTAIEGNSLTGEQVADVLGGTMVDAGRLEIREVVNYNEAMEIAVRAAERGFGWSEDLIAQISATVTQGLAVDTRGRYRSEGVSVGPYEGPHAFGVPALMRELVVWIQGTHEPPLVRSALLHLNLVAIHPFLDGNGRTARILASLELMRAGIRAPELFGIESYLRANRDEYIGQLRETLGASYDPDNHPVTAWLDYYTRFALERVAARQQLRAAMPNDFGLLAAALDGAGEPVDWVPVLLAASLAPIRTTQMATQLRISPVTLRGQMQRMARAGWLVAAGSTRGRRYEPGTRLDRLALRTPGIWGWLQSGQRDPVD
jgi:Fic family protein